MKINLLLLALLCIFFTCKVIAQEEKIEENVLQNKKLVISDKNEVEKVSSEMILQNEKAGLIIPENSASHENGIGNLATPGKDSVLKVIENPVPYARQIKGIPFGYDPSIQGNQPKAAPANDDICSATVISPAGGCLENQTTHDATPDYFGGCVPNGSNSVYYQFTLTGSNNMITFDLDDFFDMGRQINFFLFEGPCTAPTGIYVDCNFTAASISVDFFNLTAGTTYFLQISCQPGVGNEITNFDICATQAIAPPLITGPEQDCFGAIPVCDQTYVQNLSYTGYWDTQELTIGSTCLYGGENNSVWYVFTPQTSGNLAFTITTTKDYDWALYDLTAIGGCENVPGSVPVLCNYSGTLGNTGTTLPVNATIPRSVNDLGSPFMAGIPVIAGNTYALLIDNYTADINGYTLNFDISAGSASIADNPPTTGAYPFISSAAASCSSNTIVLTLSEYIDCFTIGQTDYSLTNTTTGTNFTGAITSVTGTNCASGDYTNELIITHNGTLTTGSYTLTVNAGATLQDICGNPIQPGGTVTFGFLAPITLTASDLNICGGETISLNANGADGTPSVTTYTLNPGGLTNNTNGVFSGLSPAITTTYNVSATYGGCSQSANVTINVEGNILATINPTNQTVCSFPVTLTATTTINGTACAGCTYVWSTTETTSSIIVNAAGTYTVTATTSNGCTNFNNPSSTISVAGTGGGGGTCDVLYVSPGGGGTGLTKDSPTTLALAVDMAVCTNTTIKMQKGVYTLTNYQYVPSYITIEGGYDVLFETKSSNLTGGANSTTIRRSNTADTGYPGQCCAFRVQDGAVQFRLQDLRIEMPGSASVAPLAAGSNIVNYGIKLGTSCSAYNIVRCYIDAGIGAAP